MTQLPARQREGYRVLPPKLVKPAKFVFLNCCSCCIAGQRITVGRKLCFCPLSSACVSSRLIDRKEKVCHFFPFREYGRLSSLGSQSRKSVALSGFGLVSFVRHFFSEHELNLHHRVIFSGEISSIHCISKKLDKPTVNCNGELKMTWTIRAILRGTIRQFCSLGSLPMSHAKVCVSLHICDGALTDSNLCRTYDLA